jgi:hypothetical protein
MQKFWNCEVPRVTHFWLTLWTKSSPITDGWSLCSSLCTFVHPSLNILWGGIGKFPDYYCCNCLSERRWEGRPRSHFQKPVPSVCQVTLCCEHSLFLHFTWVFFRLRVLFCLRWMAESSSVSASSFVWSSINLLLKPLKCFMRLLDNIL